MANCSGPQAEVTHLRLVPPSGEDAPYQVHATLRNHGPGHGEVSVTARLRDRPAGHAVQGEREVRLQAYERLLVVLEVHAPPGDYAPEVEAEYSPR